MTIRITNCSDNRLWYSGLVGKIYPVAIKSRIVYGVVVDDGKECTLMNVRRGDGEEV
jgi:hypothetical protein